MGEEKSELLAQLLKEDLRLISYDEDLDEEKISEALSGTDTENDLLMGVANEFLEAYYSDDSWGWDTLVRRYLDHKGIRPIIDQVFVDLCGWSLATLLERGYNR